MGITIFFIICTVVFGIDAIYQTVRCNQETNIRIKLEREREELVSNKRITILNMAREISYFSATNKGEKETVLQVLKRYGE